MRSLVFALLTPFVAGCAIHPLPDDVTRETTHSIVQKIRCEAQRGVLEQGRRLGDNTTLGYEFDFHITEINTAQGSFTLTDLFKNGSFGLTGSVGADRTRDATRNFRFTDTFGELRRTDCRPEILAKNWIYPIAGDVGMYEAVATFVQLQQVENPMTGVGTGTFSFADTLVFTTKLHGNANATLSLTPVKELRLTAASASMNNSRQDIHKVAVTMVAGPSIAAPFARGRSARRGSPPPGVIASSGLLSNTIAQQAADQDADLRSVALYELDRQRLLELQRRGLLVVTP
jgi:hypothetical protein